MSWSVPHGKIWKSSKGMNTLANHCRSEVFLHWAPLCFQGERFWPFSCTCFNQDISCCHTKNTFCGLELQQSRTPTPLKRPGGSTLGGRIRQTVVWRPKRSKSYNPENFTLLPFSQVCCHIAILWFLLNIEHSCKNYLPLASLSNMLLSKNQQLK